MENTPADSGGARKGDVSRIPSSLRGSRRRMLLNKRPGKASHFGSNGTGGKTGTDEILSQHIEASATGIINAPSAPTP